MLERIYLLHARAQSGKDTCAAIMKEEYEKRGKRVIIIAFADYVKWCLDKYYGVKDCKSPEGRTTIQHFATDLVRKNDPTFWGRTVADLLRAIEDDFDYAIIPDWRFENEYTSLASRFASNIIATVLITRPDNNKTDNMTYEQRNHQSETELDNWQIFDYNIINETCELERTHYQIIKMIEREETLFDD
jgi:hypothetical protein